MSSAQEKAHRTVFVGNLEARVRKDILYELFLLWQANISALQLPYCEMAAPLLNSTSVPPSLNHVPDLEAGHSSYEWTHQHPRDSDFYQMNKRRRQKQTIDDDSSIESNRESDYGRKFQKCKKK